MTPSRFVQVTGPLFIVECAGCHRSMKAGSEPAIGHANNVVEPETVYADLNGPAFASYYCPSCAMAHKQGEDLVPEIGNVSE